MLIAAAVLVAVSIGAWWLQRVAFSPSNDSNVAYSILGDEEIRGQVATIVAGATHRRSASPPPSSASSSTRSPRSPTAQR